jgi:DNA-binding transcriptional ArsR family regulator
MNIYSYMVKAGMKMKVRGRRFSNSIFYVNGGKVNSVKKMIKSNDVFVGLAQTFKVLGDPTRTKIIFALSKEELCVCDIAAFLGISQSATSHQLRVLRNMSLVKYRKEGRTAYYSLDDNHIKNLFDEGVRHIEER